jgi:Mrp family chromosome partitioning ATPase/uncharacterized protein involved in exopolysaccharide biosynthesis
MIVEARQPMDALMLAGPAQAAGQPSPLLIIHRALRGRYAIAAVLALFVGLGGAVIGWSVTKPLYASQGWIRAFPRQPRVLYETQENQMLPMFDAFVKAQADLLRSRRVIDLALSEQSLRDAGWPGPPAGVQELTKALDVSAQRGSELISVSVSHQNPQMAQVAANAVLTGFVRYQEEQDSLSATDRERRLRENQQVLLSELKTVRESIIRTGETFGGGNPDTFITARTDQLARLEALLADPTLMVPGPADAKAVVVAPQIPAVAPEKLSVEELAGYDAQLASMMSQSAALQVDLESNLKALSPEHREIRALRSRIESIDAAISVRAADVRRVLIEKVAAMPILPGESAPTDPAELAKHYQTLRDRTAAELRDLARARMDLRTHQENEAEVLERLGTTNRELEALRVEDEIIRGGRVRIQQRAATPLEPTTDRRLPLAAAGFVGGASAVVGIFVLAALTRRRIRYADDIRFTGAVPPLVGVIPDARQGDPESAASVVLALHHIRNTLLLLRRSTHSGGTVYLVTSSVQGEGKTTVAIALAASFAQAGYRTALVDGDLVGRGLTRELGLEGRPGFVDLLGKDFTPAAVHSCKIPGIGVMPAGRQDNENSHSLALEEMRPLVDGLRQLFDVVVVDTGPMLGSLEVGLLGQLADVILVVASRGTGNGIVSAAVERARVLRPDGIAMVFNRAHRHDFTTSASYSSVRSATSADDAARHVTPDRGRLVRLLSQSSSNAPRATDKSHALGNGDHA